MNESVVAWKHPKRGKVHRARPAREFDLVPAGKSVIVCNANPIPNDYVHVFAAYVAPEDRCRICWKGQTDE
jgi:hypothetical protein